MIKQKAFMEFTVMGDKKESVLKRIKPIMESFGIKEYDYVLDSDGNREFLTILNDKICCTGNSIDAVVDEVIGWLFVRIFCRNRSIGAFEKHTLNQVKRYWK